MIKTSLARRNFLKASLAVPFTTSLALAKEAASDVRITRVVHCRIPTKRSKLAGKNPRGGVHGDSSGDVLLRLFAEEMFPETVDDCLTFRAFLRESKLKTLVADGESHKEASTFKPFVKARAIDILQGDMKRFGFEGIMEESAMAAGENLLVAPHNWGSLVGYYMQLQVGRAVPNFYRAEHDALSTPILIADGYSRKNGLATVPDTPGCGLRIDEKAFAKEAKVFYDLKA